MYSFKAKIASRGCHVFKETSWSNAKEGDEVKVELESNKSSKKKKKIDPLLVPFVRKRNTSKDGKQLATSREKFRGMFIFL